MESVVFQDSPLAEYLEGEGEGGHEVAEKDANSRPPSPSPRFAPRGPPTVQSRFKKRLPQPLKLTIPEQGAVSRIHLAASSAVNARLGRAENARFLEQFRYTIVASQLLNAEVSASHYNGSNVVQVPASVGGTSEPAQPTVVNLTGAVGTGLGAFAFAWILHWARGGQNGRPSVSRVLLALALLAVLASTFYAYVRRQWLQYLRNQAVDAAAEFVAKSQAFDAAASAAINLIQEVELVSRGYRMLAVEPPKNYQRYADRSHRSSPMPPVSRLEERSQSRRCARLRRTLLGSLATALPPLVEACATLRPLAIEVDRDKYYDIYELSVTDIQEAEVGFSEAEFEDPETIKALKILLYRLHTLRKITFCCLLALDADGGKADFARWGIAVAELNQLSFVSGAGEEKLRKILGEEDFKVPSTPKSPLPPGRERVRMKLRKLGSLSQGIRGLQAKLHLLREESDRCLDDASDVTELGSDLMNQYESIGNDLKLLMQEWESGKAALASNIDRNEKRLSEASTGLRSPTLSLGGVTAVDGSPAEAFQTLNGEDRSRWSMELSNSEDGEVFEAIAAPRPRSMLTREERIAKMKEDRAKTAANKERTFSNTNMLRELESVINLRPRGRTAHSRITSITVPFTAKSAHTGIMLEARLEQANLLKKVVDAIKDLVQDCNFDCNDSGIALQAMDNSHVALVSMMLKAEGFSPYRCDRNIALGINLTSLTKVLRSAQNEDILTLKAEDAPDSLNLVFESSESDRLSEYDIKLMDIDQEHLGIPETDYAATISMPATEFQRICRDLVALSESVSIEATKEGVKFACQGDIGSGSVTLRQHSNVDKPDLNVEIDLTEPVALTFSLKYLVNFTKASGLSGTVKLCLSNEVPLLVEYALAGSSYLRFYLAPKIGDEE